MLQKHFNRKLESEETISHWKRKFQKVIPEGNGLFFLTDLLMHCKLEEAGMPNGFLT